MSAESPFDIMKKMFTKEQPAQELPSDQNFMVARILSMSPQGIDAALSMNICGMDRQPECAMLLGNYMIKKSNVPANRYVKKAPDGLTPKEKVHVKALQKYLNYSKEEATDAYKILKRFSINLDKVFGEKIK